MNPTLALLLRHGFAAFSGFLVQHGVAADATNTASLVAGLITYLIVCALSAASKVELSDSNKQFIQKLAGIFASQFLSAVAGWLQASAGDVADPVALSLLVGNATLSKVRGSPQGSAALKQWTGLFLLALMSLSLCSCAALTDLVIKAAPLIEEGVVYGVRTGVKAGVKELQRRKLDAKQPREGVSPSSIEQPASSNTPPPCDEPRGECAIPPCLRVVAIPDYGARVAAMR